MPLQRKDKRRNLQISIQLLLKISPRTNLFEPIENYSIFYEFYKIRASILTDED